MAKFEPDETFGRLTVTRWDSAYSVHCICSCGSAFVGAAGNMRSGATKSCGCIRKEKNNHVTHGYTGSLTHKRWLSMRARCLNKNASNYPQYGGAGIGICAEWADFERFLAKRMGAKTTEVKTSHVAFISHPREVARLIEQAASAAMK